MLLFVHAFDYMVDYRLVHYSYIALFLTDSNWLLVTLLFIVIPTSFLKFDFLYILFVYFLWNTVNAERFAEQNFRSIRGFLRVSREFFVNI